MNREETRQMHRGSNSRESRPGNAPAGAIASSSAVACVRHLIGDYHRFLKTSYRFLDPHLRAQFEAHLQQADVVIRGPWVSLTRDFERGRTLARWSPRAVPLPPQSRLSPRVSLTRRDDAQLAATSRNADCSAPNEQSH
jgi:hypothetical protein